MNIKELSQKKTKELHVLLAAKREQLRDAYFKTAAKQMKNVRGLRVLKKDIARILTLFNHGHRQDVAVSDDKTTT